MFVSWSSMQMFLSHSICGNSNETIFLRNPLENDQFYAATMSLASSRFNSELPRFFCISVCGKKNCELTINGDLKLTH